MLLIDVNSVTSSNLKVAGNSLQTVVNCQFTLNWWFVKHKTTYSNLFRYIVSLFFFSYFQIDNRFLFIFTAYIITSLWHQILRSSATSFEWALFNPWCSLTPHNRLQINCRATNDRNCFNCYTCTGSNGLNGSQDEMTKIFFSFQKRKWWSFFY